MLRHKINVEVCRVETEDYEPPKRRGSTQKPKQEEEDEADYIQVDDTTQSLDHATPSRSQPSRKRSYVEVDE